MDFRGTRVPPQAREGETQQTVDRLRLVHSDEPKRVYILSNVVLDIDVDRLVTWDEMLNGGERIERAWNALQGEVSTAPPTRPDASRASARGVGA